MNIYNNTTVSQLDNDTTSDNGSNQSKVQNDLSQPVIHPHSRHVDHDHTIS